MSKRLWEKNLAIALQTRPAQRWLKAQNERETARQVSREATGIPTDHSTVAWTDRANLTPAQKDTMERMLSFGWQVYGFVFCLEERAVAIAVKSADGLHGLLYPNGDLDRGTCWKVRRINSWSVSSNTLLVDHRLKCAAPVVGIDKLIYVEDRHVPVENFPSQARKVSRLYVEMEAV